MYLTLYLHREFTVIRENLNAIKHSIVLCLLLGQRKTWNVLWIVFSFNSDPGSQSINNCCMTSTVWVVYSQQGWKHNERENTTNGQSICLVTQDMLFTPLWQWQLYKYVNKDFSSILAVSILWLLGVLRVISAIQTTKYDNHYRKVTSI